MGWDRLRDGKIGEVVRVGKAAALHKVDPDPVPKQPLFSEAPSRASHRLFFRVHCVDLEFRGSRKGGRQAAVPNPGKKAEAPPDACERQDATGFLLPGARTTGSVRLSTARPRVTSGLARGRPVAVNVAGRGAHKQVSFCGREPSGFSLHCCSPESLARGRVKSHDLPLAAGNEQTASQDQFSLVWACRHPLRFGPDQAGAGGLLELYTFTGEFLELGRSSRVGFGNPPRLLHFFESFQLRRMIAAFLQVCHAVESDDLLAVCQIPLLACGHKAAAAKPAKADVAPLLTHGHDLVSAEVVDLPVREQGGRSPHIALRFIAPRVPSFVDHAAREHVQGTG